MTKTLLTAALLLTMTPGSPLAKEVIRNEDGDLAVRGAACEFSAKVDGVWQRVPSSCHMYKDAATNNTLVWIGKGRIVIARDKDERGFAKLYRVDPDTDDLGFMGNAVAKGNCWVGAVARFCSR